MSDPPPLIESLRRQLSRPDLEESERLALAEALNRRLADAVEGDQTSAADEAISLLGTLTGPDNAPPSVVASAARGLGQAHFRLRVEKERENRQTARILRGLRTLASRPDAPLAARLALGDALEQEVQALAWADNWSAARSALDELRENYAAGKTAAAAEPLARALSGMVCCACTLRPSTPRRPWLDEIKTLERDWPNSLGVRVALAETLGRELVVAIDVGQHILAHTLLMDVRAIIDSLGHARLGLLPEVMCAAVVTAIRTEREVLARDCLSAVRTLITLPEAIERHGDQLAEALFSCFVRASGDSILPETDALLDDLRTVVCRPDATRTQRFYLAKALYNRHHDAGDTRDWTRCSTLLDEIRWLARAGEDEDLHEVYVQALGNAHYDAWHCGQVTRAEQAFHELLRAVSSGDPSLTQQLEVAKAFHRRHADAVDVGNIELAVEQLDALQALCRDTVVDDLVRFEVGDALAVHYADAVRSADIGRARACRASLEALCTEADDDADLRSLLADIN